MKPSALPVVALLALAAFAACGESSSSDDDNGAAGGAGCAKDEDCAEPLPKCSQAGECVDDGWCDVDADCRGDYGFCATFFHMCGPCLTDADCPSETPVCVPGWEYGLYCAPCRRGDSSTCAAGTICTPDLLPTGGGQCEAPNCPSAPEGKPCIACINEHADVCLGDGGECEGAHAALDACTAAQIVPEECFDEADAFDACLSGCEAALALCASGEGAACVSDDDCAAPTSKCTQAGKCVYEYQCDTDADCRDGIALCDTYGFCQPCLEDADCPSQTPVCVSGYEHDFYCTECRSGDSSPCPHGTWCRPDPVGNGGTCELPNCATAPAGNACIACINANAGACLAESGECEGAHAELDACYAMEMTVGCQTGTVPSRRSCTPETCFDEADAFDACLLGCNVALALCE